MSRYDQLRADDLERRLRLPKIVTFDEIGSTLDVAHALASEGAPEGTLVLADAQTAGRGRMGRSWRSEKGAGIWLTLIERPRDPQALDLLSLRIGLALAPVLDFFATDTVQLKWPNDLYVSGRKLGGILVEARWRDGAPDWVAIGVGINLRPPAEEPRAIGLRPRAERLTVLDAIVPAIRSATGLAGLLTEFEQKAFAARDYARGRACLEPVRGTVEGIDAAGALLVAAEPAGSTPVAVRAGSLLLAEEPS